MYFLLQETAMQYNYSYGDGGVVDQTSAEFKALGDNIKAKKKESVETAMKYNYNYGDGGVVDQTSAEFKALGDNIKAKKKESVETAMKYNYNYGDGGVVDQTSAEFKALGDKVKAAKKESVGKPYSVLECLDEFVLLSSLMCDVCNPIPTSLQRPP